MKVLVAEKYGFCPGVKIAIMLADETLAEHKDVYSLGPLIHNDDVVRELARREITSVLVEGGANVFTEVLKDREAGFVSSGQ